MGDEKRYIGGDKNNREEIFYISFQSIAEKMVFPFRGRVSPIIEYGSMLELKGGTCADYNCF